ncbi:MAG: hypothetical protein QG635_1878 [Bacteroidota bacterium]|nr:hypothetical protein [Bacteroidota bacterium]
MEPDEDDPRQSLAAFYCSKSDTQIQSSDLLEYCRKKLPDVMLPGSFTALEEIPVTPNGKADYRKIKEYKTVSSPVNAGIIPPRDTIELEILNIWRKIIKTNEIGIDDNFFQIGGHSLLAVQIISQINISFGVRLPLAALFEHGTVERLAKLIRKSEIVLHNSPIVKIREGKSDSPQLFFVHPAGGNVLCYYELASGISSDVQFYGLQSTRFGNISNEKLSINSIAREYVNEILQLRNPGKYILGGWSMGALAAFEMAQILSEEKRENPPVVILDQIAPSYSNEDEIIFSTEEERLALFAGKVEQLVGEELNITIGDLTGKTPLLQSEIFLDRFIKRGLVPDGTKVDEFHGFLELMITHNDITARYKTDMYEGNIILFRAEESVSLSSKISVGSSKINIRSKDLGWEKYSRNPLKIISVPGNHVTMITKPNVQVLAEKLGGIVSNVQF